MGIEKTTMDVQSIEFLKALFILCKAYDNEHVEYPEHKREGQAVYEWIEKQFIEHSEPDKFNAKTL